MAARRRLTTITDHWRFDVVKVPATAVAEAAAIGHGSATKPHIYNNMTMGHGEH